MNKHNSTVLSSQRLKIEYKNQIEEAKGRSSFKSVSEKEHIEIVSMYANGIGYNVIAEKLGCSTHYTPIHRHNNAIKRAGFCVVCRRAGGKNENKFVKKGGTRDN